MADLRGTDFSGAKLVRASFEGAKVNGAKLDRALVGDNPDAQVDLSSEGDGSHMVSVREWLDQQKLTPAH